MNSDCSRATQVTLRDLEVVETPNGGALGVVVANRSPNDMAAHDFTQDVSIDSVTHDVVDNDFSHDVVNEAYTDVESDTVRLIEPNQQPAAYDDDYRDSCEPQHVDSDDVTAPSLQFTRFGVLIPLFGVIMAVIDWCVRLALHSMAWMSVGYCVVSDAFSAFALVACLTGFYKATKLASRRHRYEPGAVFLLLLLSAFVGFMFQFARLLSQMQFYRHPLPNVEDAVRNLTCVLDVTQPAVAPLLVVDALLQLLLIYAQTTFLLHVCYMRAEPYGALSLMKHRALKLIMLFLVIFNFFKWTVASFDANGSIGECLSILYFSLEHWTFFRHLVVPIMAYYHFQCFSLLLLYLIRI